MVAVKDKIPHNADGSINLDAWFEEIKIRHDLSDLDLIKKATIFSDKSSKGLVTFYGQSCLEQALEISEIILDLKLDQDAVAAAILTNVTAHTSLPSEILKKEFGDTIAKIIEGVNQMQVISDLIKMPNKNRDPAQIDKVRKTLLAMVSDIRVVLIKLAERTVMMRGIKNINHIEKKKIATETIDIYAPLANRLGIGQIKWELEDLSFRYIDPEKYLQLASSLAEKRADRQKRIHTVIKNLNEHLTKANIFGAISGRAKHIYSIFLKMQKKHLDYKNIYDTSAIRVLLPTIEDCYNALSIVHHLWEHIPEEFDDYIANPKPNGYRSIHTAIYGPDNKILEIQLRTFAMHNEAEHGVAAHWVYKENKPKQSGYEEKIKFLRELLSWQKEIATKDSSPATTVNQIFDDRVYIFTPEGDIIDLPQGATPIDAAYYIHTNLGHRCRGAKINGHIVTLTHALHTGDKIEIISVPNGTPSRDWLNKELGYIKTSRARAKASQWFRHQEINQYVETGKNVLDREFARAGLQHVDLLKMAQRFHFKNATALLSTIGHGSLRPAQIVHAAKVEQHKSLAKTAVLIKSKKPIADTQKNLHITGATDLLTRLAKCCKPIPGDPIIGYITQGRGVTIHRSDCHNLTTLSHEKDSRMLTVDWSSQSISGFYVDLQINAEGNEHALKEITSMLANAKIDLISMNSTINRNTKLLFLALTIQINNKDQLNKFIHDIKLLPFINSIRRVQN